PNSTAFSEIPTGGPLLTLRWGQRLQPRLSPRSRRKVGAGVHVHRRVGKTLYRASVMAGPFRLSTNMTTQLGKAQQFLEVLQRIRARVNAQEEAQPGELDALEVRFRQALHEESEGSRRHGMKLHFYAKIPASYWVGQALSTPHFRVSDGLELGLQAWKRLALARTQVFPGRTNRYTILRRHGPEDLQAAWEILRRKHIDVWADAGRCPAQAAARLDDLEAKHQPCRERLARRWKSRRREADCAERVVQETIQQILTSWRPKRQL
ncbi:unnamed protein product, partial [Effrenium voratum]